MLGIELLLNYREKVLLEEIRRNSENGFLQLEKALNLPSPMIQEDLMPSVLSLIDCGLIALGKKGQQENWIFLIDWTSTKKIFPTEFLPLKYSSIFMNEVNETRKNQPAIFGRIFKREIPNTQEEIIFKYWQDCLHTKRKMTLEDRSAIKKMCLDYSMQEIKSAIRGLTASPWHLGDNPQGIVYDTLRHIKNNFQTFLQLSRTL